MADIYATIDGGTPSGSEQSLVGEMGDLLLIVSQQLQDEFAVNWPPSKMLPYVNLALLEIANLAPESSPEERVVTLSAGTRQELSHTTTLSLMSAICNVSGTTDVIGQTVTTVKKTALDHMLPGWMTFPQGASVSYVAKDEQNPLVFHVFPPVAAASKIKMLVSTPPDEVTADTTDFPLNKTYIPAFIDYMIYRCIGEETTVQNSQAKAAAYYNKFLQHLGIKTAVEKSNNEKAR
jgi:hypothetical protein